MSNVLTTVKSAWASKINWTMALGVIFSGLTMFGVPVDDELKVQVLALGNSLIYVIGWVLRTFFTTAITSASAKKL